MRWTRFVVAGLVVWAILGGAGVATADPADGNPACDSPSQGQERSVEASNGTSLEQARKGLNTALARIGCERRL